MECEVLYEEYRRPRPGWVSRLATRLIEAARGRRIWFRRATRLGSAIVMCRDGTIRAACNLYVRSYRTLFCYGEPDAILLVARKLGVRNVMVPAHVKLPGSIIFDFKDLVIYYLPFKAEAVPS